MLSSNRDQYSKKRRNKRILQCSVVGVFVISVISLASYISHRPDIRISKVELSGGVLVTEVDIASETLSFVSGSYLWLFPKNNVFWYPRKALSEHLKVLFKRIDTINIHLKDFYTLSVDIKERKPVAIWCDTLPNVEPNKEPATNRPKCYFVDQNGAIFSEAPNFSGDAYFKYYGLVATDTPIGSYYISSTTKFGEISNFVEDIRRLSLQPLYIVGKNEGEFILTLSSGGQIYFDTKESLTKTGMNLESLLRTPDFATTTGNSSIDYVDLRYGNKLFYKLR